MAAFVKRVLVLHGYSQNGTIFSKRLGALRKECKDIEFVFVDAPHLLLPSELHGSTAQLDSEGISADAPSDPETTPRGWWKADRERKKARGIEESILTIRDVLKTQRFDGVLGFSQGAAFAAVISALLERPSLHPPFLVDGEAPHPPFQFCIAVSGFKVLDPFCDPFFTPSYQTPTLHVIGRTDVVVVEERSQQLVVVSANARVEEHDGGHFVPSKGNWRKFLAGYMRDHNAPHVSPTAVLASGPSSGTATPTGGLDYKNAVMMKL